jgi:alpha-tubulin suppressor-like RCC1 family protein
MARTTRRARSVRRGGMGGDTRGLEARRAPIRSLLALLAAVLLTAAALSATASATVPGGRAAVSAAGLLETPKAPAVTKQPLSATVEEGQNATFEAAASGVPAPSVKWEVSTNGGGTWTAVAGATSSQLKVLGATTSESGHQYRAAFKNSAGEAISKAATLTVQRVPSVTLQPTAVTVEEGQSAVFEAAASGFPAPTVQWERSTNAGATWSLLSGATTGKLTIASAKTSESGYQFRAAFKNAAGKATSEAATLTVRKAPAVTKQPLPTTVTEGESAVFEAAASGVPAPTVQWEVSTNAGGTWAQLEGDTSPTLTIVGVKYAENGYEYRAVFKNAAGSATSAAATLTVLVPPAVTLQPSGVTVEEGHSASFEAAASGVPAPTVQWERSINAGATWTLVSGATTGKLTIASTKTSESGYEFRAAFKNAAGKATSEAATLTVRRAPAVTKQPVAITVTEGESAAFEATASGFPTPTVQWEVSVNAGATWSALAGATSATLTIANAKYAENGYEYRAVFTNAAGSATSAAATLTVLVPPAVTLQPSGVTVEEGHSASFEAAASGVPAPTVQWERSINAGATWTLVSGATTDTLTIASTKTSESGYEFRATFKNAVGKVTTAVATLTVQKAPAVTKQPVAATVLEGETAMFEATASGFPAPTVQWEVSTDGGVSWSSVPGATSDQLAITNASTSQSGSQYRAVFTNAAGKATSAAATLTVYAPPVVTEQPASTTVEVGTGASFEAKATGFPTPTVQWEISTNAGSSWSAVAGATSDQLTIASTVVSENGNEYRAVFTNPGGKATSTAAILTVATTHYAAVAWGQNLSKQLGNGSFEAFSDVPVPVSSLKFVTSVAAGGTHSLALLANTTVVAWGGNEFGQLGNGTTNTSSVPVAVSGLSGVKAIAAGGNHSLALLSNGTVMAWGDNEAGQLGNGSVVSSEVPVPVKGLTGVKEIAAGGSHSLALLANGTVMAWGANELGQLGNGTIKSSNVPVAVKGLTGATAISAGGEFSLALVGKGAVEAWGSDEAGQLGNTTIEEPSSSLPVPVGTLTGVTAIAAGAQHGLALLGGGTVMAWGEDNYGELGNGVIKAHELTPVAVSGLTGVTAISAGGQDSVALMSGGSMMAWGVNRWGALGDGVTGSPSAVPVPVSGIDKVASVSAGGLHMLAFGEPIPVVMKLSPNVGPTSGGTTVTISGASLTGATAVKFGTIAAASFTVNSASTVTAVAPAGTGTVDVTVTTPAGTSPPVVADRYTFQPPPTVTKLTPRSGPVAGGTTVTITGTVFNGATQVTFGETSVPFTINSSTTITAVSPPSPAGNTDVTVTTVGGTSAHTVKDHFGYTPTVEGVTPNSGPVAGHSSVTVTGTGFTAGTATTSFKFGNNKATSVVCASSTSCTMVVPAALAAGTVNVLATANKVSSPVNAPADDYTYS